MTLDALELQVLIKKALFKSQKGVDSFIASATIDDAFLNLQIDTDGFDSKHAMKLALQLTFWSVLNGGGPFGAVIVKNDRIISYGSNHVVKHSDPTDHGEVNALRRAFLHAKQSDVMGATLFTSTYPCPMCCGLAIDSGIDQIVYCNTELDAETHGGFKDQIFWEKVNTVAQSQASSLTHFRMDGNSIVVLPDNGESLDIVLRRYCQVHGVEPKGLRFDSHVENIALSLYEYTALHWAGVDLPKSVGIKSFSLPKFVQDCDFQHVGQSIFQLFKQIGDDYGQKC
tara:strand:- start:746 stop:1597 length:852 start_codon:yes stop_codon:yes gene_type:complete